MPKVIPIQKIESWSFSRYNVYRQCPKKAYFKFILKLKEPDSPQMQRGTDIHLMAEQFVKGILKKLPQELNHFAEDFSHLKKQKVKYVEESWTFRKDWTETAWNDWKGAWLRVKLDVAYLNTEHNVLVPIDYKTGKYSDYKKDEYEEQLELYGLASLKKFPHIDAVSPRLWYLDHGIVHPNPEESEILYERKDEAYLEKLWLSKVKAMLSDTTFKAKPGNACTYCHFKKANSGPCKY